MRVITFAGIAAGAFAVGAQSACEAAQSPPLINQGAVEAAKAFIRSTGGRLDVKEAAPAPSNSPPAPSLGIGFRLTSGGAEIIAIMPGSPAEAARLLPGQLVTSVNGASLAGLTPDAAIVMLRSRSTSITYGLAGGLAATLLRPPDQPLSLGR